MTTPKFDVTIRCTAGHEQKLKIEGQTQEQAQLFCELLCGTSVLYVKKPSDDPVSPVGKCAACGAQISATMKSV